MDERVLTGTRIRNRRLDLGLKQADVAGQLGISASYMNLIEHNRRRIGSQLLVELAQVLKVDAVLLSDGTAEAILAPLREAAAAHPGALVEEARADELVARFPGWAGLIAAQQARIERLEERAAALSDRLAHDTQIAQSLHEVISTATSIRSTASILAETPDLDREWQARFHGNIDTDSARLADSSQALLGFLDMEGDGGVSDGATPLENAEAALSQRGHVIALDDAFDDVEDTAARSILQSWKDQVVLDEQRLPLAEVATAARAVAYDPGRLAARLGIGLDQAMRRMAQLPAGEDHPVMGLAVCDAAGVVTFQKPVLDFRLPRSAGACPLWPIYQALTQPGRPIRRTVRLSGAARTPFDCFAVAGPQGDVSFDDDPRIVSTMLVRPAKGTEQPAPVGPGCRLCSIEGCASRRQPGIT